MTERLWKILSAEGRPCHGGIGKWHLPKGNRPGKWMPKIKGELVLCENGYHLCRDADLVHWLGEKIHSAEGRGARLDGDTKIVVEQARIYKALETWNARTQRLFACDCAERALSKVENPDERSIECIRVSRLYANGRATKEELRAARYAAGYAAWAAAWDAAYAARYVAGYVARYVAGYVARYAARYAAWAAAWDAARSAAESAARSAARSAAESAARSAARSAAWSAERLWQTKILFEYLEEEK